MIPTTAERFTLDREALREHLEHEYGDDTDLGISTFDGTPVGSKAIAAAYDAAWEAGAIGGIDDLEAFVYDVDDGVLISVREEGALPALRQVATPSIEAKRLIDEGTPDTFDGMVTVLRELLDRASELVPALRLLQAAERLGAR
jgi:hypothetical protein